MSIDHAAVGRLIRYGLEPKLTPARSADYAELVGRARNDSEFAAAAVEIAHGEGLEVLEIDPLLGISLAAMHDSPFTMRLDHYSRGSNEDRLLHALVQLAIAATAYPTAEALDDDRLQSVTVGEIVDRVRHVATRLRDRLAARTAVSLSPAGAGDVHDPRRAGPHADADWSREACAPVPCRPGPGRPARWGGTRHVSAACKVSDPRARCRGPTR